MLRPLKTRETRVRPCLGQEVPKARDYLIDVPATPTLSDATVVLPRLATGRAGVPNLNGQSHRMSNSADTCLCDHVFSETGISRTFYMNVRWLRPPGGGKKP